MGDEARAKDQGAWFVRDDPVADLSVRDHFGHRSYTEVLAEAILQAVPPFTIGVFGSWGVGKTTIAKSYLAAALQKKARGSRIAYAYFDVWKYEGDSLRRQFLREVAQQFKDAAVLDKKYDTERELQDLVVDTREPIEEGVRFSWPHLTTALLRGAIGFGITFLAIRLLQTLDLVKTGSDLPLSLMVGVLSAFMGEMRKIVIVGQREIVRKSIEAPDLFEGKFKALMNNVTAKRAVIVVDNLDRCTPDRVMEVLSTIKTFLEPAAARVQPIFVVPCDHLAIRRHLMERGEIQGGDADEYLRKFFNATLRINPILEEEIRQYVNDELAGLSLAVGMSDDHKRELAQVITVAFRGNPRRVKQFLNTLTSKVMLLREREAQKYITPPISAEVAFLAKLTVIEEEWPEFYRAIQTDPHSFEQLSELAIGIQSEIAEPLGQLRNDQRLLGFLRGTRGTTSENVRAFTRLKLSPVERKIANYWDYRNALVDGRLEEVAAILNELLAEKAESYREATEEILRDEVSNEYYESALNVIDAVIRTDVLRHPALAHSVSEQLYSVQQLRVLIPSLAPQETLAFLGHVEAEAARLLVGEFIKLLGLEDLSPYVPKERMPRWQAEVGKGLAAIDERLDSGQVTKLRELCVGSLATNLQFTYEFARLNDGPKRYLGPESVAAAVQSISLDGLRLKDDGSLQHSHASAVWLRCLAIATNENVSAFVQKMTELLTQIPLDPSAPGREETLLLLLDSESALEDSSPPTSDQLAEQLKNHYQYTPAHRRWLVVSVLSALHQGLSPNWQQEAVSLATQFASSENVREVGALVAHAVKEGLDSFPQPIRDALWVRLKERYKMSTQPQDHQGIVGLFVTHVSALGWEHVQDLFKQAIDARNIPALVNALEEHKETIKAQQPMILETTLEWLVMALSNYETGQQAQGFEGAWALADVISDENRMKLRDHILKLVCSDDVTVRNIGLELLTESESRGVIRETERRHIGEQVVLWLTGRIDSLDETHRPVFDRLVKDASLVEESTADNLVTVLKGVLGRGPGFRVLASQYLSRMPLPKARRDEVLEELLHAARQETEWGQREQVIRHAFAVAGRDRRTKGARAVEGLLRELRNGTEQERALAVELLGEESED